MDHSGRVSLAILRQRLYIFQLLSAIFAKMTAAESGVQHPCPPPSLPAGPGDADLSPGIIVIIIIICPTDTPKWPESGLILWQPPILFNGKIFAKVKIYVKPSGADRVIWSQIITQENIFATVKNYLGIRPEMVKLFHATKQYVSGCFSIGDTYAAISN